ncbi:Leucoanthocyanidin reductase [Linum grandiflorum]
MATISNSTIKSRVLIIGATGLIGRFVAEASLDSGRPTYLLTRTSNSSVNPAKAQLLKSLEDRGAIILQGSISDKESIETILKDNKIEVVISIVGGGNLLHQLTLVDAIKSVGTVKRFLPSEFGHDVDRADPVEPGLAMYLEKRQVRRWIEQNGIPYTYICCNSIASWPYYDNTHPSEVPPPVDHLPIYADGSIKAYFVAGPDIGKFTIKTLDDDRTINKSVHFRPDVNCYNMNELALLWEKKIGRSIPRVTVTESDLLAVAAENRIPESIVASFTHDIFIKGCQSNFEIDGVNDLDASALYPDEAFETVDQVFAEFALAVQKKN